ncbi:DNA-3-methyladenine glycosylase I [Monoraphidium neglectum]|uniref:DNA-3-methyladenine glycosylase I n=1 Tax=Monoraphidium neglectum TaxID=145388 RepID=A0A0D2M3Q8_9CHLO|nr:DNA-3-methyladenine glycosylase I [Monoraphidium neglectum]KIY98189.1 DNA-3-methyladenine glycosylase I [Monoraphidium neglectum]|eukprot:XP_013897209.1 DNA-3-methyladenine glycosylase I [Monoraphidium neglectum]
MLGARRQAVPKPRPQGASAGDDGRPRCPWSNAFTGAAAEAYVAYHDTEWGRPTRDDWELFELIVLEGAQAGLSWSTILKKRDAYRAAFEGFDPVKVAAFGEDKVEALLAPDSGIVRHRAKIASAINNARCVLEIQKVHGSFSEWVWAFAGPGGTPVVNHWTELSQVPASTPASAALSAALKKEGFSFVGPTTCYSFMQATGMVNDHLVSCFCHGQLAGGGGGSGGGGGGGNDVIDGSGGGGDDAGGDAPEVTRPRRGRKA